MNRGTQAGRLCQVYYSCLYQLIQRSPSGGCWCMFLSTTETNSLSELLYVSLVASEPRGFNCDSRIVILSARCVLLIKLSSRCHDNGYLLSSSHHARTITSNRNRKWLGLSEPTMTSLPVASGNDQWPSNATPTQVTRSSLEVDNAWTRHVCHG